ncbi:2-keto-4-pentenoate hydratase/2-oxohepta-3-ene-1,7-dioic acid hydratase in catechol pathway [Arthrobacter sp. GAS37]|uniref:fumarylacetoacetate hydrolase family protein n=1 Tax=Arthrobacter sp. GAS37 TaxID=3156261 RepID=UPI003838DA7D
MHLATIMQKDDAKAVIVHPGRGVATVEDLVPGFSGDAMTLLDDELFATACAAAEAAPDEVFTARETVVFTAPYRSPRKIWGIGLNYRAHAGDLSENVPTEPASFMKGDHTIIGQDGQIVLPEQSERVTAEAELGIVIGRYCRDVSEEEALDYVWGVVPILDQTAEDILQRNPRFLTRSKNFPSFFSFGPEIVPLDEVLGDDGSLEDVVVKTVRNGEVWRENTVSQMTFSPAFLVSFHSKVMPLYPGDIISPGTPGAVVIRAGDVVESSIPGVGTLRNTVIAQNPVA